METIWMEHPIERARNARFPTPPATGGPVARRRRFWCAEAGREVEVQFEERGWCPGLWLSTAVKSCPVFDPPTAVACRRRCLDARFRRRWEFALPVRTKAGGGG